MIVIWKMLRLSFYTVKLLAKCWTWWWKFVSRPGKKSGNLFRFLVGTLFEYKQQSPIGDFTYHWEHTISNQWMAIILLPKTKTKKPLFYLDSSVGKSSASQSRDLGSNPGEGLTRVTQFMNERGRDCQL